MLFTSLEFLLFFLPTVLLLYFPLPHRAKNVWLLLASLFFYAWGEPSFLPVMLLSILFNYLCALLIARFFRAGRGILTLAVVGNLGLLFVFKYANFFTSLLHPLIPSLPKTSIPLPIGISFFTFQAMSYVIDVYRGTPERKNPLDLGLYIALFPQLIAGPIVRYSDVAREIDQRKVTWERLSAGILRFLRGFNKKVLLANALSAVADAAFASESLGTGLSWLGIVAYALQIYFDFSGYSEMAIGLGLMLGFSFPENFNDPYISGTVSEFWRRWHITLGAWFRDYLYFPLGGSRVSSRARLVFNLAIVWLSTGFWHGASWNFLLWGAWYGILIGAEKLLGIPRRLQRHRSLRALYRGFTLLAVLVGWVFFRADGIGAAGHYLGAMLGVEGEGADAFFYLREYFVIFAAAILCATPFLRKLQRCALSGDESRANLYRRLSAAWQIVLFAVSVSFIVMDAHNPFIYFNF